MKKLIYIPTQSLDMDENPCADWSAHLFVAERTQYILVANTASLYTMVMYGWGITDESEFFKRAIEYLGEVMETDGNHSSVSESFFRKPAALSKRRRLFGL